MKSIVQIAMIVSLIFISGCKKYKKTSPTQFTISMDTENPDVDYLSISSVNFHLSSISANGTREKGSDLSFYRPLDETFIVSTIYQNDKLNFDLPQGNYTSLSVDLGMSDTDWPIIITGEYESSQGPTAPFILKIHEEVNIRSSITTSATISAKNKTKATAALSSINWFEGVPRGHFQSAYTHDIVQQNQDAIYITGTINEDIYEQVIENLTLSGTLLIE